MQGLITRRILERVAENRILDAQQRGAFDDLPGKGRPLPALDEPYDPMWWVRSWMRRERLESGLLGTLPGGGAGARALLVRELIDRDVTTSPGTPWSRARSRR